MSKAAIISKPGDVTPNGRERRWELRQGAKGTGGLIQAVTFWPWSEKSVEQAERVMSAAAERAGVEIADNDIWRA